MSTPEYWMHEAGKLAGRADMLRNSGTSKQNMTPRRKRIYEGQLKEAEKLERLSAICKGLAHPDRPRAVCLCWVRNVNDVSAILKGFDHNRLVRLGIVGAGRLEALAALDELARRYANAEKAAADEIKKAELELVGLKIPGFFPTPPHIIDLMIRCADIGPDVKKILEPSAGKGDLIAAAQKAAPWAEIHWCEVSGRLIDLLTKRFLGTGHLQSRDVDGCTYTDFMHTKPDQQYDLVLMNPPFENGRDIDHVLHAFGHLRPHGRLVAVMSEGSFFRSDKKARGFQTWAAACGAYAQRLPGGAFKSAFVPTGVQTRLLVVDASQAAREADAGMIAELSEKM